jgi:flagellar basal-body rod modification protein FlgD
MQTTLSTTGSNASSSATLTNGGSISDLFTKLLVAQIKNQNPLEPSDPSQFVNQLTQLSQMESLQRLATLASNNGTILQDMQMLTLGSQVGSDVTVTTDSVTLSGSAVHGTFSLNSTDPDVAVVLTGVDGVKHRFDLGPQSAGDVNFSIDPVKLGLAPGTYSIAVASVGGETPPIGITSQLSSVRLSPSGTALLTVANVGQVQSSAITQFNGRQTANAN